MLVSEIKVPRDSNVGGRKENTLSPRVHLGDSNVKIISALFGNKHPHQWAWGGGRKQLEKWVCLSLYLGSVQGKLEKWLETKTTTLLVWVIFRILYWTHSQSVCALFKVWVEPPLAPTGISSLTHPLPASLCHHRVWGEEARQKPRIPAPLSLSCTLSAARSDSDSHDHQWSVLLFRFLRSSARP